MAAFQTNVAVGRLVGPGRSANVITRTSDGTLYTATNNPVAVYKSIDYGHNWIVDETFTQDRSIGNSQWRMAIAVDGNNKLHLAWGCWDRPVTYDVGYLCYATKASGGTWSGVTDIATYSPSNTVSGENAVYGMVIDSLNQPHILYLVRQSPDIPEYYLTHYWKDSSWNSEAIYGGGWQDAASLVIDPSNTLYELYEPGDYYAKKPFGGSWSTHAVSGFTPNQFCADEDGNLHFCSLTQYKKLSSAGTWGTLETFASVDIIHSSISVTRDGIVHIVGFYASTYKLYHYERSTDGTWSYTDLATYSSVVPTAGLLHAIFPSNPYCCLLRSGYAFMSKLGDYSISYLAYGEIPATAIIYPSDAITRVTGLHHIYNPGMYRLGIQLGDVSNTIEIVERAARKKIEEIPKPAIPEPPRPPTPSVWPGGRERFEEPPTPGVWPGGRERFMEEEPKPPTPLHRGGLVGGLESLGAGFVGMGGGLEAYRQKKLAEEQAAKAAKAAQPPASLWSKMTPWKEEKGETFISSLKGLFGR